MIDDDWLWDIHFEQPEEESENVNGEFERELKEEEKYYEKKYKNRNISVD